MITVTLIIIALHLTAGESVPRELLSKHSTSPLIFGSRVVGGVPTTIEEHPSLASLQYIGFHFCGGSIISQHFVLTAAHCTTSYPASSVEVRVGSTNKLFGGQLHKVETVARHDEYVLQPNGVPKNDVAVLKLKTPIEFGETTQPLPLFALDEESKPEAVSTITGWGRLIEGGSTPDVLYTVDVPIVSKTLCNEVYATFGGIPEGQICAMAPEGSRNSCHGDSGSPVTIGGRQAGIVSWALGCARKGYPGVYTEIAAVRNWIAEHTDLTV